MYPKPQSVLKKSLLYRGNTMSEPAEPPLRISYWHDSALMILLPSRRFRSWSYMCIGGASVSRSKSDPMLFCPTWHRLRQLCQGHWQMTNCHRERRLIWPFSVVLLFLYVGWIPCDTHQASHFRKIFFSVFSHIFRARFYNDFFCFVVYVYV